MKERWFFEIGKKLLTAIVQVGSMFDQDLLVLAIGNKSDTLKHRL